MTTPTAVASRWRELALSIGIDACVRCIRDELVVAPEAELAALAGGLRLLQGGYFLTALQAAALRALLDSEAGRNVASQAVVTPRARELTNELAQLQADLQAKIAAHTEVERERQAVATLIIRRGTLVAKRDELRVRRAALEAEP